MPENFKQAYRLAGQAQAYKVILQKIMQFTCTAMLSHSPQQPLAITFHVCFHEKIGGLVTSQSIPSRAAQPAQAGIAAVSPPSEGLACIGLDAPECTLLN